MPVTSAIRPSWQNFSSGGRSTRAGSRMCPPHATRGDVMNSAALGSADFASSLESYFRFFETCTGTTIDRVHPDLTPVLARPFASSESSCTNWSHVPHGIQGFLFMLADALVKN